MALLWVPQDREHQDTDADHECLSSSSISAAPVTNTAVEPLWSAEGTLPCRDDAAYAICQVARKEERTDSFGRV